MEIDGVQMQPGDRVLLTGQRSRRRRLLDWLLRRPAKTENGIYEVLRMAISDEGTNPWGKGSYQLSREQIQASLDRAWKMQPGWDYSPFPPVHPKDYERAAQALGITDRPLTWAEYWTGFYQAERDR